MAEEDKSREELIHQLRNVQAERQALKHLLLRATKLIDTLAEPDCAESDRQKAKAEAERFRQVAS